MRREAVDAPIEHEYRNVISDNLRWNRFTVRPGDIFVCTPPKCGTTWMQAIVAELLFPHGIAGARLWEVCPWIDARFEPIDDVVDRLEAQEHRRSIKTHTAADGIPWHATASYIVVGRDGRDAFMSMFNHLRSMRPEVLERLAVSAVQDGIELRGAAPVPLEDIHEYFAWSMNDNPMWLTHVASFWKHHGEPNLLFVHYNDMQIDLEGEMRRVASFLDIDVEEERWPRAVERCTFTSMKQRSDEIGDFESHFIGGADSFLYKGTNDRWREVLTSDELALFDRRCREVLPADAVAWTSEGRSALTLDAERTSR